MTTPADTALESAREAVTAFARLDREADEREEGTPDYPAERVRTLIAAFKTLDASMTGGRSRPPVAWVPLAEGEDPNEREEYPCTGHREMCRFGRDHLWFIGFYDLTSVWHTAMVCGQCGVICDEELRMDDERCSCGANYPHPAVKTAMNLRL